MSCFPEFESKRFFTILQGGKLQIMRDAQAYAPTASVVSKAMAKSLLMRYKH